jgi:hypothetical protein
VTYLGDFEARNKSKIYNICARNRQRSADTTPADENSKSTACGSQQSLLAAPDLHFLPRLPLFLDAKSQMKHPNGVRKVETPGAGKGESP